MLPKYRNRRKVTLLIILFALILLACLITDIVPDPCSTTWLITKITAANLDPDTDTIDLDPGCTYEFDEINNSDINGDGIAFFRLHPPCTTGMPLCCPSMNPRKSPAVCVVSRGETVTSLH